MKSFWDTRYDTDNFVYGREPNGFFASSIKDLSPGKVLLPGEGEGRNAVYAAGLGWEVDAFDQSGVAAEKARYLMEAEGVQVNYRVSELAEYLFKEEHYDLVGLIFFHAIPSVRQLLHSQVMKSLKPGGTLILEAFHTSQLGNATGGPQALEMLYDGNILTTDFSSLKTEILEELTEKLSEGPFHQGEAGLIRYIGIK